MVISTVFNVFNMLRWVRSAQLVNLLSRKAVLFRWKEAFAIQAPVNLSLIMPF